MARRVLWPVTVGLVLLVGFIAGQAYHKSKGNERSRSVLYYVDPMHPAYHSSKPGKAPDCGMDLEPVYTEDLGRVVLSSKDSGGSQIRIDRTAQQLYGISLSTVRRNAGSEPVRLFGRVTADQTRVFRVNLGTDGYVKETHDDAVGNHVRKDQHLAVVYSPDFLSVVGGYLSANERSPAAAGKEIAGSAQNAASAQARADRLRNLGMSDAQIEEIATTRKIPEDVYVVSPTDGFILSRNITPGLRFERQTDLYTIADLSHVWIMAEIFGTDVSLIRPGTPLQVKLPDSQDVFKARVSDVLPEVDPTSHLLRVRVDVDNPGFKLRPDMFVDVELPGARRPGLTVPIDSVLDTGSVKRVFVETSEGSFEAREVVTGRQSGNDVEILSGLADGEAVASSGAFLIDSESRIRLAANPAMKVPGNAEKDLAMAPVARR